MKLTRKIHGQDFKAIAEHFRKANPGVRFRVEFKDLEAKIDVEIPSHWSAPCRPLTLGHEDCDSGSETSREELTIPTEGEFWLDVQYAVNAEPPGCEPFWEPQDWVRADFKDGRLIRLDPGTVGK